MTEEDLRYCGDKWTTKGHLIDLTYGSISFLSHWSHVLAMHMGTDGYSVKERKDQITSEDKMWNLQYFRGIRGRHASLNYAHYTFRRINKRNGRVGLSDGGPKRNYTDVYSLALSSFVCSKQRDVTIHFQSQIVRKYQCSTTHEDSDPKKPRPRRLPARKRLPSDTAPSWEAPAKARRTSPHTCTRKPPGETWTAPSTCHSLLSPLPASCYTLQTEPPSGEERWSPRSAVHSSRCSSNRASEDSPTCLWRKNRCSPGRTIRDSSSDSRPEKHQLSSCGTAQCAFYDGTGSSSSPESEQEQESMRISCPSERRVPLSERETCSQCHLPPYPMSTPLPPTRPLPLLSLSCTPNDACTCHRWYHCIDGPETGDTSDFRPGWSHHSICCWNTQGSFLSRYPTNNQQLGQIPTEESKESNQITASPSWFSSCPLTWTPSASFDIRLVEFAIMEPQTRQ